MSSATDTLDPPGGRPALLEFLLSSIGAKMLMAFSGAGLWLYLILHIGGNLTVLTDRTVFNDYAEMLQTNPFLLWTERALVFGGLIVHAIMGVRLTQLNRAASKERPVPRANDTSTLASRTMVISGAVILAFFVYHILHFTAHAVGGATFTTETLPGGHVRPDAAAMVYSAFSRPGIVAVYVIAQLLVFVHLYHGSVSLFQSFGFYPLFHNKWVRRAANVFVLALAAAAIAIPLVIFRRS